MGEERLLFLHNVRDQGVGLKLDCELTTNFLVFSDTSPQPYVMNHGGLGPITAQSIIDRRNEIDLFLSTRFI